MIAMDKTTYRFRDKEGNPRSIQLTGHRLLVRKCIKDVTKYLVNDGIPLQQTENAAFAPNEEAILKTLTEETPINSCEILAIGPKYGQPFTKSERRERGIKHNQVPLDVEIGDIVVVKERSPTIFNTVTGAIYDCIIDETDIEFKV